MYVAGCVVLSESEQFGVITQIGFPVHFIFLKNIEIYLDDN